MRNLSFPGRLPRCGTILRMQRRIGLIFFGAVGISVAIAGCGLNVQSPDLFLLKRSGQGQTLTLLVNDGGTIRCNGGKPKQLSDQMLLQARALATSLDKDAKAKLQIATAAAGSVNFYTVKLQDGKITFPDTAAASHQELAQTELFAVQAAQSYCGQP
jgi:hypothetical protein